MYTHTHTDNFIYTFKNTNHVVLKTTQLQMSQHVDKKSLVMLAINSVPEIQRNAASLVLDTGILHFEDYTYRKLRPTTSTGFGRN